MYLSVLIFTMTTRDDRSTAGAPIVSLLPAALDCHIKDPRETDGMESTPGSPLLTWFNFSLKHE